MVASHQKKGKHETSLLIQVASNSAQNAERDASETEDADKLKNVALATYKASSAAVRSLEAAEAAAEAEKLATEAASLATNAGTALAFSNALSTAQAFNGVHSSTPAQKREILYLLILEIALLALHCLSCQLCSLLIYDLESACI